MTVAGSDNASTLPPASFSYANARLSTATNGLGGSVSFTYERVQTRPLYSSCEAYVTGEFGNVVDCGMWAPSLTTDPYGYTVAVGHILSAADWETVPLYRACTSAAYPRDEWGNIIGPPWCSEYGLGSAPDGWGFSTLLGHAEGNTIVGLQAVYSACKSPAWNEYNQVVGCADWTAATTPDPWGLSTLVGYSYLSALDRYRVSQRAVTDGRGGTVTTAYDYRDLGLSPNGTEFRGHGAVRAIDALGNYTDTWFYQDDLKKGRPYAAETRSESGALYARVSSTWSTTNPYPGVTFVRLDRTDAYSYEGGSTPKQTAMTVEYDAYGNITRAVNLGDVAVSGDDRDERTDWAVDATSWLMRPTRVALHDGGGALLRERWLSYDGLGWGSLGARGLLTRDEARLAGGRGTSGNPVVTHAYDGSGNRTSTTDPRGCTTTTAYEAEQVYPASATTCLGHTTTFAHDARFGARTSLTDPNGQTTTSTYDVFGRLTRVTGPFDTGSTYGSVSTFYENLGSPSAQRILTYRTEQHGTGNVLWSAQYFDGLGRVYKTEAEGPGGQVIVSETTFDSRGLVAQRSAPRFTAEGALWTTLSYDALGRPVQVRHPDSSVATTSYALSGVAGAVSQVAVTDERGTLRRRHLTAHGQVLRVEEVNGAETSVTTYQYDAAGALTQVTDHAGRVTTMTYDALGRKGAMQDPNMGSWTYGYDITGNLTSQTDARGQTLTFSYDLQGRILTKTYPGGAQILWTYDDPAVPYSRGRLTRVDDLAVSTRFTYNALGRVTQTVRLLDATTYVMSQSYDALGRVVTQTFPDSETVTYSYNDAGWLSAIPGYVTSLTYNARGQRTQMQYANGVTATWTYDATTFRLSQAQAASGATSLQHLTYTYDAGGLITGITDSLWTGSRTFGYDALGRLLSASGPFGALSGGLPGQTTETYTYAPPATSSPGPASLTRTARRPPPPTTSFVDPPG